MSVSALVRELLSQCASGDRPDSSYETPRGAVRDDRRRLRVSFRVSADDAARLSAGAKAAGLPLGSYVLELMDSRGSSPNASDRAALIAALTHSSAELSTLSRNIAHLTALLRQGAGRAALEYRGVLVALDGDVRAHLARSSSVLADPWLRRGLACRGGRHE